MGETQEEAAHGAMSKAGWPLLVPEPLPVAVNKFILISTSDQGAGARSNTSRVTPDASSLALLGIIQCPETHGAVPAGKLIFAL